MNNIITYLFTNYYSGQESKWLRKLLYSFLIYKCFYWFLNFDLLFGVKNIVTIHYSPLSFIDSLAYLFYYSNTGINGGILISLCLILGLNELFFNAVPRISAVITWLVVCNISNAIYPTLHGGDRLFEQLLLFNIFLSAQKEIKNPVLADADKVLHNFGVIAIMFQICLVYFIAGLSKFMDNDWLNGMAVIQTCNTEYVSIPVLYDISFIGVFKFLNYFVMAYQLLFPLLVWFKKTNKWILLFGVVQHLYIAFIMGLPSFGFIMIIAYSIFYFPWSKKIQKL